MKLWEERDPIKYLISKLNDQEIKEFDIYNRSLIEEIDLAFEIAQSSTPPDESSITENIYFDSK